LRWGRGSRFLVHLGGSAALERRGEHLPLAGTGLTFTQWQVLAALDELIDAWHLFLKNEV